MPDDSSNTHGTDQSNQEKDFHLGVLFVHGIGTQRRGQTLAEFGAPVYFWLVDRFRGLDRRWRKVIENNPQQPALEQWRNQIEAWASDGFPAEGGLEEDTKGRSENRMVPDSGLLYQLADKLKCDTLVGRVFLTDTVIHDPKDPSAPAHAELRFLRQRIDKSLKLEMKLEKWLLTESWWAESFSPPSFAALARWGLRIIPWTVGSHFGVHVRRIMAQRPAGTTEGNSSQRTIRWLYWLGSLLLSLLGLIIGLMASPLFLLALTVLLLVGLLPIPQVREALLKFQLKVASTLGDSYVLVTRPIEAASIVGQVRRDTGWLANHCKAVVVVAHSQGGAVAHEALQGGVTPKLRLLFTFGSGLKKLEELKYLLSSGRAFLHSGVLTLIALPFFSLSLWWFALLPVYQPSGKGGSDLLGQVAIMLVCLFGSLIFLVAGLRDYVGGVDLPDLQRWIQRLKKMPLAWADCFASADPVSNGILLEEPGVKESSEEVCNEASIRKDHTSYWANRDQFLTVLIGRLTRPNLREEVGLPPAPELATDEACQAWIGKHRRWRVGILKAIGWIGVLSIFLAIYREQQAWWDFVVYSSQQLFSWGTGLLGERLTPTNNFVISWSALGYLALVLIPYWITRWLWRVWNETEMRAVVQGGVEGLNISVLLGIFVQLLIAAIVFYGDFNVLRDDHWGYLVYFISLVGPAVLIFVMEPSAPDSIKQIETSASSDESRTQADQVTAFLKGFFLPLLFPFIFGMIFWIGLVWYFEGSMSGNELNKDWSMLVGVAVAVVYWIAATLWVRLRGGS